MAFMLELEEELTDVFEVFNEAIDCVLEEYPKHPPMSLWRLMTKLWISEVYSKEVLKENMFGCFLKILSIRRQENFLF